MYVFVSVFVYVSVYGYVYFLFLCVLSFVVLDRLWRVLAILTCK